MTETIHLRLPQIEAAQAQKHVIHNEALAILDALVMPAVLDRDLAAPPPSPSEGDRYLVKPTGVGGFAGKDNQIAHYVDGGWSFYPPGEGWTCYVADEGTLIAWNGAAWTPAIDVVGAALQNVTLFGLGATADATNPLTARLNNALFAAKTVAEGGDGDLRYKLSKESAGKTLSFLFQNDYSGRAEIGLAGDDDFHFKVSPDGAAWIEAFTLDRTNGATRIAAALQFAGVLTPASIASDQNDYSPAGLATSTVLRLSSDAARNITGLAGGSDGRIIVAYNVGAQSIVLKDESSSSTAANRFALTADLTLAPDAVALLQYDGTTQRWRAVAGAGGGSAAAVLHTAQTLTAGQKDQALANLGMPPSSLPLGFRNRFINGGMAVDQRNEGASQTITAGAALAYTLDRWYAYCTGANVAGQRVAGGGLSPRRYQFTGAAGVTKIGFAQRIEAENIAHLAGQAVTLSVDLANALLTTVTWTAWRGGAVDTFGTLASPNRTQIATGTWTVNSTLARYSAQISLPAEATNGVEIEFSVGAQTSGTWTIANAQIEAGGVATPFEQRHNAAERMLCDYYARVLDSCAMSAGAAYTSTILTLRFNFGAAMRGVPAVSFIGSGNFTVSDDYAGAHSNAGPSFAGWINVTRTGARFGVDGFSGLTPGRIYLGTTAAGNLLGVLFDAEMRA